MSGAHQDSEAFGQVFDTKLVLQAHAEELDAALAGYAGGVRQNIEEIITRIEVSVSRQAPGAIFSVDRAQAMSFFVEHLRGEK